MYSGDEGMYPVPPPAAASGGAGASKKGRKRKGGWEVAPVLAPTPGIEFAALLDLCLAKLLVGSDAALRTHLIELKVWLH